MIVYIVEAEGWILGVFESKQDADKHAEFCRAKWTEPSVSGHSVTAKTLEKDEKMEGAKSGHKD
jgi:hypothetical protein